MTEGREVASYGGDSRAVAAQSESANIILTILEAARDPGVDAAKVETMANLAMKLQDRELEAQFNRDLNAAIMEMPVVTKAGIIIIPANSSKGTPARTQGRFARFEDIDRVVRPILMRHNLALRFEVGESNRAISVRPILSHANGHTERGGAMHLPVDDSGAKNNVQGAGSAVSYGKRYTMCALLNIITEGTDDDGSLGKHAIDMPHERELVVLEGAEEAAANGAYDAWYAAQGVKDRAWLVSSGHHARLGGVALLPGAGTPQQRRAEPATQQRTSHDITTPEGWTAQYEDDCRHAADLDGLEQIQTKGEPGLRRLKAGHPALHERAIKAGQDAHTRLFEGGE